MALLLCFIMFCGVKKFLRACAWLAFALTPVWAITLIEADIDESLYPESPEETIILKNSAYIAAFSERRGGPVWVAYATKYPFEFDNLPRPRKFKIDARLPRSPTNGDYMRSGYDRGHMAPNYAIMRSYGKRAQEETFLLSNVLPQSPILNRGVWKRLEHYIVENLSQVYGRVVVFAGPVYPKSEAQKLGGEKPSREIDIPESTFMVVAVKTAKTTHVLGFIMPQNPDSPDIWRYARPVREIEQKTGLNFFKRKTTRAHDLREKSTEIERFNFRKN